MPAEAFVVEAGPEETYAEGDGGEYRGEDAAAHLGAGGVFVRQRAEANTGVAHAWSGLAEGEEEELVGEGEEEEGSYRGYGRGLETDGDRGDAKFAAGEGEGGYEAEEGGKDQDAIDHDGHEAPVEECGLRGRDRHETGFGDFDEWGWGGLGAKHHGGPLGRDGFDDGSGGELGGFDLEDAQLGGCGGEVGFFAKRTFGQTGARFAGGDELTGKLDEIGGDFDGRDGGLEDG